MVDAKPLASLTGGLLARKGAAKPAMRRPAFAVHGNNAAAIDDLGWDDMGYDVDPQANHAADDDHVADVDTVSLRGALTPFPTAAFSQAAPETDAESEGQEDAAADAVSEQAAEAVAAPETATPESKVDTGVPSIVEASPTRLSISELIRQRQLLAQKVKSESVADESDAAPADTVVRLGLPASPQAPQEAPVVAARQVLVRTPRPEPRAGNEAGARTQHGARNKAAFTLRIDPERHLRLRLASAVTRRSAQVILIDALDKYLKSLPDIDALAHQVPPTK